MSQRCTKCGTTLHDAVKFCPICGQRFGAVGAAVSLAADNARPDHSRTKSIDASAQAGNARTQAIQPPTQAIGQSDPGVNPPTQAIGQSDPGANPPTQAIGQSDPGVNPPTQPIQQSTKATQPPTQPIRQSTQAIQPPTQPIQQSTQPIRQSAQPIRSSTQAMPPRTRSDKTNYTKLAALFMACFLVIGLIVLHLLTPSGDVKSSKSAAAVEPNSQTAEPSAAPKAGKKGAESDGYKTIDCFVLYPKQMRKPSVGKELGGLYPFSDYLAEYAEKAQANLDKEAKCHKDDLAAWRTTSEYKKLQARVEFYQGKDRQKLMRAYGRRYIISFKDCRNAHVIAAAHTASSEERSLRFMEDNGFSDCGILTPSADGSYDEASQTFTGIGPSADAYRGGGRLNEIQFKNVKVRISPKGAVWGDRKFGVFIYPRAEE